MKTYSAKPKEIEQHWYLVDAEGQTLGRLATRIADTLRGKRKPEYTPHIDTGDFVVVVNAEKIQVTGSKLDSKLYYRHSGYPGGLRSRTLREQLERRPTEVIRTAVKGMLPKNRLASAQIRKLKIYAGPEHPHAALLFADFVLSQEGQTILKDRNRVPSSRAVDTHLNDFPFEMIDPTITLDEEEKWTKLWSDLFLRGQRVPRETDG